MPKQQLVLHRGIAAVVSALSLACSPPAVVAQGSPCLGPDATGCGSPLRSWLGHPIRASVSNPAPTGSSGLRWLGAQKSSLSLFSSATYLGSSRTGSQVAPARVNISQPERRSYASSYNLNPSSKSPSAIRTCPSYIGER